MSKKTKIWLIAAACLMVTGGILFTGVMTSMGWDFKKLTTDKMETNEYVISEAYENITVKSGYADITFVPSEDTQTRVTCYEYENVKHTVEAKDGVLTVGVVDSRKWYDHIGIHFEKPRLTVAVPKGEYGKLTVDNTTGDVRLPQGITFGDMDISVTTGDLFLGASATGHISCKSTTGEVKMRGVRCAALTASGTTGDLEMEDVVVSGKITVTRTTGDVEFERCDGGELYIKVSTGDVEGTLLTPKTFKCKATTGKVDVPNPSEGGLCQIKTTTGDIEIRVR